MDQPHVAVVTESRRLKRHVSRAMASAGWTVTHVVAEQSALREELGKKRSMYIVDAEGDPDTLRWLMLKLYREHSDVSSLLLSHDVENNLVADLIDDESLSNLVARHGGISASDDLIDEAELIVTCQKLHLRDIFGLEKYISTWGVRTHEYTIGSTDDKDSALTAMERFLGDIDCHRSLVPPIALVADELLMNGIFNAPHDESGTRKYAELARSKSLTLLPKEQVKFRFACDGRYVGLAVEDNFGSLDRDVIVKYLKHSFLGSQAKIEEKKAGAGLGLFMVFNSITQLSFNIEEGKRTEVVALFYIRNGGRAFKASGRSLNIFLLR